MSLEEIGIKTGNEKAMILAETLDEAVGKVLDNDKSPTPRTGEMDNRGNHFYLALYWAQALAAQDADAELKARFAPLADALTADEAKIVDELNAAQGVAIDLGGYFKPDVALASEAMRPSATFNAALAAL